MLQNIEGARNRKLTFIRHRPNIELYELLLWQTGLRQSKPGQLDIPGHEVQRRHRPPQPVYDAACATSNIEERNCRREVSTYGPADQICASDEPEMARLRVC